MMVLVQVAMEFAAHVSFLNNMKYPLTIVDNFDIVMTSF